MSSPFWSYPGVRNGRIIPRRASPQGTEEDFYYGFVYYTYSYAYQYYSGQAFCLGSDRSTEDARLLHGATARITQSVDLTGIDILLFCMRLITKASMPQPRTLLANGALNILAGSLIASGDGAQGLLLPENADSLISKGEDERGLLINGTTLNDGYSTLRAVPWNQGGVVSDPTAPQVLNGRVAVLDEIAGPEAVPNGASVKLLGARWIARAYVDGSLRVELTEKPGRSWQRNYLALHVSKLSGFHDVSFHIQLDAAVE